MINILNYNISSDYETNKDLLSQLDNYVALTEDNQMVHLKPLPNIFYVTTNNTGTTIYKHTDNQNGIAVFTLENGENKFTDWKYGFYFNYGTKQNQITSFDLSKYDTSNVTDMHSMFSGCTSLSSLDLSNFDTSKVTNISGIFASCSGLTSLDLSKFDTSNITSMFGMFYDCSGLTSLNLSRFNTSKVTDIGSMFENCRVLTSLDVSNFDTSNVTRMSNMFYNCTKLTHIKCKQAFKDWCITNQDKIKLPTAMRNGTVGTNSSYNWEIVE